MKGSLGVELGRACFMIAKRDTNFHFNPSNLMELPYEKITHLFRYSLFPQKLSNIEPLAAFITHLMIFLVVSLSANIALVCNGLDGILYLRQP